MTSTVTALLDALGAHLATFELPDLYSVTVTASTRTPTISAQLAEDDAAQLAAGLLDWADTLTEPTAEAWRIPAGDSVHLTITGRLPNGDTVRVYGGMPFHQHGVGAELAPGARSPLLLGTLRAVAALGEVRS